MDIAPQAQNVDETGLPDPNAYAAGRANPVLSSSVQALAAGSTPASVALPAPRDTPSARRLSAMRTS
jgi:hypothetical protein